MESPPLVTCLIKHLSERLAETVSGTHLHKKMTLNFIKQTLESVTCLLHKSSSLLVMSVCSLRLFCYSGLKQVSSHFPADFTGPSLQGPTDKSIMTC